MWVRSQDKRILVHSTNILMVYDNGTYIIKSFIEKYNYFDLGRYSTKEKALKVLDMIEQSVSGFIDEETAQFYDYCVFKMPQDSEV